MVEISDDGKAQTQAYDFVCTDTSPSSRKSMRQVSDREKSTRARQYIEDRDIKFSLDLKDAQNKMTEIKIKRAMVLRNARMLGLRN
jgi:hypothetical protein